MRERAFSLGIPGLFALMVAPGCVTPPRQSARPDAPRSAAGAETSRVGARSDVVTPAELMESRATSTGEAVRRLRPEFLRPTSMATPTGVVSVLAVVYVNNAYAGGPDMLSTIPLGAIEEIRFVTAAQAHDEWGSSCTCRGGVIHVRTKR